MKFLCDNCKAKYQIADDKVAGKTVRMKCRKCGHLIEIRASVTDASVATGLPAEAVVSERPPPAAEVTATPIPRPGALPRTSGAIASVKKPAPSAGTTKPSAPYAKPAPSAPKPAPRPSGGLASAFTKSVKDEPKQVDDDNVTRALDMSSPASTEEWYVGVHGIPVGPVRLSEVRAKAQAGAITEDSLVWREGFEEWLPLKTFPELLALLPAAGVSHTPPPPASARAQSLSNPAMSGRKSTTPPPRSNVIPFSRAATAEKLEPAPIDAIADPFAAPPPAAVPAAVTSSSEPLAPVAPTVSPAYAPTPSEAPPPPRRAGGIPAAAWIAIVAALALGVTAGSVLFSKPPPPPTVQIVTVTAPATAPPPTTGAPDPGTDSKPEPSAGPAKTAGPRLAQAGPANPPERKDEPPPPTPLPGGLTPLPGGPGPLPGPGPAGPSPGGGADQLSQSDVQRVVNNGRNSLKRACWEPALAAKSANAPSSAKVTVTMTIGPDGRVRSSSATGGDGYPGLASCIGSRVRSWVFPSSTSETTVAPSFTFVPQ